LATTKIGKRKGGGAVSEERKTRAFERSGYASQSVTFAQFLKGWPATVKNIKKVRQALEEREAPEEPKTKVKVPKALHHDK
jgi:lysozyme family protein